MAAPKAVLIGEGTTSVPLQAWCDPCSALTEMVKPGPVKLANGVAMRDGTCGTCGEPTWRVGGGKAKGHE